MGIQWLFESIHSYAEREALIYDDEVIPYSALLDHVQLWQTRLRDWTIQPGEVIMLEGDYSPEICGALLALISNCNIVVPLSPHVAHKRNELMEIAEVQRHWQIGKDQLVTEVFERTVGHELLKGIASREGGLVLFSSGSTGAPKGIVHRWSKLLEKYKTKRDTLRTLTFLLFDHIGGINTLLHTLSNGGTIICPGSRSAPDICAMIEKHHIELLPATPSFLNMLLITEAYKHYDLSSLKMITYGTEVMPEGMLKRLNEYLPGVQFRQTYGLSELGILRTKSKASDSLWLTIGGEGVETKIVDDLLYIRSKNAMEGYLNAPDPFDEEGWFNTADQVICDGGYIRIMGRKSDIINVGGQKVYPTEIEEVLMEMPEIRDVIVKGQPNSVMGSVVAAVVNVREEMDVRELKRKIRLFCQDKLEPFQIPVYVSIQQNELFSNRFKKIRKQGNAK